MPRSEPPAPPPHPERQPPANRWELGAAVLDLFGRLTNERLLLMLLMLLIGAVGWGVREQARVMSEEKMYLARVYEENRAEDRRHCDVREDKAQAFYATQMEVQRKHDSEREDKARERTDKVAALVERVGGTLTLLVAKIAELEATVKKP